MSTLVVALLLPGLYLAVAPQAPAEAQIINLGTMIDFTAIANFIKDIGDKIIRAAQIAFQIALYKTVKYAVRQLGDQSAQWVGRQVSGGRVGQEPLFWEQTPQEMAEQAGEAAGGFFIEGLAEGMAMEEEAKSGAPKDRAGKASRGAVLQRAQQIVNQMCNPDPRFRFDLLAGIVGNLSLSFGLPFPPLGMLPIPLTKKTEKPACTFTQAYQNWKKVATDISSKAYEQLQDAIKTVSNFPKAIAEALEQDKRDVTDVIDRISKMNTNLTNDSEYMAKAKELTTIIVNKLGVPTDLNTADITTLQKGLSGFQSNLRALPTDPDVKGKLDAVRAKVKEKAPDATIQPKLDALKAYLNDSTYSSSKEPIRRVFDAITGIDDPFIIDRLREMQGMEKTNDQDSTRFDAPLLDLLNNENLTSRAYFNRAEKVITNLGSDPKIRQLIGGAQDAAGTQQQLEQENAQRRATGNLTSWQVLQDLTDPSKASDLTVKSRTQSELDTFLAKMREDAVLKRTENNGIRPVTTLSGQVTSPPLSVAALVSGSIAGQVNQEGKFTGNAVVDAADLIGEFADSILGKSGQLIMEGFTKTNPDQPIAQQNKIDELAKMISAVGTGGEPPSIGKACPEGGCPAGQVCDSGTKTCQPKDTGKQCSNDTQCASPLVCDSTTNKCKLPSRITQGLRQCPTVACSDGYVCNTRTGQCELSDRLPFTQTNVGPPGEGPGHEGPDLQYPPNEGNPNTGDISNPNDSVSLRPPSELITNPAASPDIVRRASIEARISKLVALPPSKEEQINVLGTLSSDCVAGSPDSCTIRPAFAQSIQKQMTVAESIARFKQTGGSSGLDENGIFGYKRGLAGQAIEPDLSQGIPYSSMVVLRKYRIVPIAWEITALYIRDHPGICGTRDCTLGDVVRNYSNKTSPLYKLIDPNWVLKAPGAKCMLQGSGPPIEQIGGDTGPTNENAQWICRSDPTEDRGVDESNPSKAKQCKVEYKIQPRAQICLDQQTCIDEDSKGRCKGYGYCLEEKKRWQFSGTECRKQFSSCLSFTNTANRVTTSFLRDSLTAFGYGTTCNEDNAGCAWYSKALAKKDPNTDGSQRSQYDWDQAQKTYFTTKAKDLSCTPDAEGCSKLALQATGADAYLKVAPSSYGCDQNLTGENPTQPVGYKKDICKGFALHCPSAYAGCASYTPTNGDVPVAGISPIACDAACVGLARFSQVPTQLETPSRISYDFIPSAAQMCSADQAGCDEFTNLEGGGQSGGEQRDYYSTITRCVKRLASAPDQRAAHQDVFYSWTGSETGGAQLEKFLLVSTDDAARSPVCWKNPSGASSCDCVSALNGPGRPLCRQFFRLNPDGSPNTTQSWWRIQSDLVYVTDTADCAQYRRTLDGSASQNRYYISKSLSATCPAVAAGCREYHSTSAGNIIALPPDTFSDGSSGVWAQAPVSGSVLSITATKEGETLGDYSLKATTNDPAAQNLAIQKPVALRSGSVLIGFAVKGPSGASVAARLYASADADAGLLAGETSLAQTTGSSAAADTLDGSWQYYQFAMSNMALVPGASPALRITLSKGNAASLNQFYLDDVTVRQSDGFLFAIKESWQGKSPAQCYVAKSGSGTEKDWNTGDPNQLSCQTYTDAVGNRMVFQRFSALCPKEMVGCSAFANGSATLSLVNDSKKYCREQDAKCTAYGKPQFDTKKGVVSYQNVFYKILPSEIDTSNPDYGKGICKQSETECQNFTTVYSNAYFKHPGVNITRWRPAKDEEKDQHPNGVWYYMTCGVNEEDGSDPTKCVSDSQCPNGKQCIRQNIIADDDMSLARLCPSGQNTCSRITDPECRASDPAVPSYLTLRTNYGRVTGSSDTGIACQREYYYLDDVYASTGQCTGSVDVEKGCLLFQADYPTGGANTKTPPKYDTAIIYSAEPDDLNIQNQVNKDANVLAKVRLDRACKTWLGCTDEEVDATGHRICKERRPCLELDENGECANFADLDTKSSMPELKGRIRFDGANAALARNTMFASLAGLSRPEVWIKGSPTNDTLHITQHDGFFDWSGSATEIPMAVDPNDDVRLLAKEVPATCRSHPQKDTPSEQKRGPGGVSPLGDINQCNYERDGNEYKGLEGFCLENYPKRGYEKYCLNWYPTDKPAGALPAFDRSASGEGGRAYAAGNPKPVNFCIARDIVTLYNQPWDSARTIASWNQSDTVGITPASRQLTFTLTVAKNGSNNCPAWGIAGGGRHCGITENSATDSSKKVCNTLGADPICSGTCELKSTGKQCGRAETSATDSSKKTCTTLGSATECSGTCELKSTTARCSRSGTSCTFGSNCNYQCNNITTTKHCDVPSGWALLSNSCNSNSTCEVTKASTCQPNKRVCDDPDHFTRNCSTNADCNYTATITRYDNGQCTDYGLYWSTYPPNNCSGLDNFSCQQDCGDGKWCNYPTAGKHCTRGCTISYCPSESYTVQESRQGTCYNSTAATCVAVSGETPNVNNCSTDSNSYGGSVGTCSVKKQSTCSPDAPVMRCSNLPSTACTNDPSCAETCEYASTNKYCTNIPRQQSQSGSQCSDNTACADTCQYVSTNKYCTNIPRQQSQSGSQCSTNSNCADTCIPDPNTTKMSCNVFSTSQTETGEVKTPVTGDLSPANITIKDANGNPLQYSIPLTEANINSIAYTVRIDGGSQFAADSDNWSSITHSRWKWFGYWGGAALGNPRKQNLQNSYPPTETCDPGGNEWGMITPYFGNGGGGTLQGFKYALCASAIANDRNVEVTVTITMSPQKYQSARVAKQLKLSDNYCTEFATTVDVNGHAIPLVPLRNPWTPDAINAVDASKPYSFGGQKEVLNEKEWRVVTPGTLPSSIQTSSYQVAETNPSNTETAATHNVPAYNPISTSVVPLDGSVSVRALFAKIYGFFTLNAGKTGYSASDASSSNGGVTKESLWNTTIGGVSDFPSISSRRCAQPAPDNSEVMCSATKTCPLGEANCTTVRDNTFIMSFPRESANQQIATMQFYAWAIGSKTPLRRMDINWGDNVWRNIYNTVTSGTTFLGDNQDGFAGKPFLESYATPEQKKEYTFVRTYPTTFWRNKNNADGTNICVFVQDNWYFWKKVCGRFKKGAAGFIELDNTYNADGFANGWKVENGKGNYGPNQPGP